MKAYKGFNNDMTCSGFQYEEGKEYTTNSAKLCESGFHACKYPIDCFKFYNPAYSEFHEVELDGDIDDTDERRKKEFKEFKLDSKICATKIKVGLKLNIVNIVKAAIDFTMSRIKSEAKSDEDYSVSSTTKGRSTSSTTGDYSASSISSATGNRSVSSATGDYSTSFATGLFSNSSTTTGDYSASSATGERSVSSAIGDYSASITSGYRSVSSAIGDYSASSATGNFSVSSATGNFSVSSATEDYSVSSTTGMRSVSSATGNFSVSSATEDYSVSSVEGKGSVSCTTGYKSDAIANNPSAIAVAWGYKGRAKGVKGSRIVLADWENGENDICFYYQGSNETDLTFKGAKMVKIDGRKYKADTWYTMKEGKIVEWEDE